VPSLAEPVIVDGRLRALEQPTLDAGGLLVRPWQLGDVPALLNAYQDPLSDTLILLAGRRRHGS